MSLGVPTICPDCGHRHDVDEFDLCEVGSLLPVDRDDLIPRPEEANSATHRSTRETGQQHRARNRRGKKQRQRQHAADAAR